MTERPSMPDRLMLYSLHIEWNLPDWFADLDQQPDKSVLDAWRWSWREFGSGIYSVRSVGKDLGWTLSSFARAKEGRDKLGRYWDVGVAGPSVETLAAYMGVDRRSLTKPIQQGHETGWWIYVEGNKSRPSRFWLSLPKERPADPLRIERRDRRGETPGAVINGIEAPLVNGDERGDKRTERGDQWHEHEVIPNPESESERISQSFGDLYPPREAGQVVIEYISGQYEGERRAVTPADARALAGMARIVDVDEDVA